MNSLSRRDFIKGVAVLMGAAGVSSVASSPVAALSSSPAKDTTRPSRTDENGLTMRKRKYKYPWWVKAVDRITTEINPKIAEKPPLLNYTNYFNAVMSEEEVGKLNAAAKAYVKEGIEKKIPGRTLPDLALHYAAHGFITLGSTGSFDSPRSITTQANSEIQSYNIHPPKDFGLPAWQATPEEASKIVEAAGIQLGASMVGFTKINPLWLYQYVDINPKAADVKISPATREFVIPERFKYVIIFIAQGPRDLLVRNQSELGAAGDRAAYSRVFSAASNLIRFVKGLGYGTVQMNTISPVIPYAIAAGLGELGRMNRMINPVFGGNVRIEGILTDLPLAPDKPIDFGLQEFCKKCKKCATHCPSGALSIADEPYWIPANSFQAPGKKVYFENNEACATWISKRGNYCSSCLAVCPWSKQDKTALHEIAKILSSNVPQASNLFLNLDDAFGYGLKLDSREQADWWDLDIPELGIDSYQGKA
jgi:reductive dehalogenase